MTIEPFSASRAARLLECHGSANLEAAIPGYVKPVQDDTKASAKGTALHEILETSAGLLTPREMVSFAESFRYLGELRQRRRFRMLLEARGTMWWLSTAPKTSADVVLYTQDELHILDHKFGKLIVDLENNAQLMSYACAFIGLAPKAKHVTLHVAQPFIDHFEEIQYSRAELERFMTDTKAAHDAIQAGDLALTPSDHCTFCPVR